MIIELLCILFLLFNALICWTWVSMRDKLPWYGRRGVKIAVQGLVVFVGVWHLLFAGLKLLCLLLEVVK